MFDQMQVTGMTGRLGRRRIAKTSPSAGKKRPLCCMYFQPSRPRETRNAESKGVDEAKPSLELSRTETAEKPNKKHVSPSLTASALPNELMPIC
mmetsp:Transcript_6896/g.20979  ORF Transcript_6896/g.20979 Transcript_6896/m.20979 type:complete len:94 (+) Transcript_6896:225-506(+)